MKKTTIAKVARKVLDLIPLFAVIIVFLMTTIILPPAIQYTAIRGQMSWHEFWAKANSYVNSSGECLEDWGDGRKEKYDELDKQIDELVETSVVAKLCNDYGSIGFSVKELVRDAILLILGGMWLLSIVWLAATADAEINYRKRMYLKKKKKCEQAQMQSSNREYRCLTRMMRSGSRN